jgi:hypothetical protein
MGVLHRLSFFQKLDDNFCPIENPKKRVDCHAGSFEVSARILRDLGMDSEDIEDVIAVLHSKRASCNCEVLYNVVEESRLKARYCKARYAEIVGEERHVAESGEGSLIPEP